MTSEYLEQRAKGVVSQGFRKACPKGFAGTVRVVSFPKFQKRKQGMHTEHCRLSANSTGQRV